MNKLSLSFMTTYVNCLMQKMTTVTFLTSVIDKGSNLK